MKYSAIAVSAVLAVWGTVTAILAAGGAYSSPTGGAPWPLIASVAIPPLAFLASMAWSSSARRWVQSGDPILMASLQSWRILGGVFLVVAWFGHLPWEFALPAGLGDMAVGLAAPFVTRSMRKRSRNSTLALYALTAGGLLDFVVAVGSGTLVRMGVIPTADPAAVSLMGAMDTLPLVIIPAFFVPAFAIAHIAAVVQVGRD